MGFDRASPAQAAYRASNATFIGLHGVTTCLYSPSYWQIDVSITAQFRPYSKPFIIFFRYGTSPTPCQRRFAPTAVPLHPIIRDLITQFREHERNPFSNTPQAAVPAFPSTLWNVGGLAVASALGMTIPILRHTMILK